MKRAYVPPLAVLSILLALCLWNGHKMTESTQRWRDQLQQTAALAQAGDWPAAVDALRKSYQDWSGSQTYLHIVSRHDALDDAEAMYQRALSFGVAREDSEFQAEVSDLRDQLRLLAEMERLNVKNLL